MRLGEYKTYSAFRKITFKGGPLDGKRVNFCGHDVDGPIWHKAEDGGRHLYEYRINEAHYVRSRTKNEESK